jgi:hypothetical protein
MHIYMHEVMFNFLKYYVRKLSFIRFQARVDDGKIYSVNPYR